jgi:hypothetical protein
VAAAAIDTDDGPSHPALVSPDTTDPYELAAEYNSAASASQAAPAASIGPDPGPAYICAELISGGRIAKSIAAQLPS